jgi:hypothetical protein
MEELLEALNDCNDKNVTQIILDISMFDDKEIEQAIKNNGPLTLFGIPVKHTLLENGKFEIEWEEYENETK